MNGLLLCVAMNRRFSFLSFSLSLVPSHGRIPYRGTYGDNLLTAREPRAGNNMRRAPSKTGTRSITRGFYLRRFTRSEVNKDDARACGCIARRTGVSRARRYSSASDRCSWRARNQSPREPFIHDRRYFSHRSTSLRARGSRGRLRNRMLLAWVRSAPFIPSRKIRGENLALSMLAQRGLAGYPKGVGRGRSGGAEYRT